MCDTTRQHRKWIRIVSQGYTNDTTFTETLRLDHTSPSDLLEIRKRTVRTTSTYSESSGCGQDPGERSRYSDYATGWTIRDSNPGRGRFSETSRPALGPETPPIQWVLGLFPRETSSRGSKLTTHPHLVPTLKMCGAKPRLPYTPSLREGIKTFTFFFTGFRAASFYVWCSPFSLNHPANNRKLSKAITFLLYPLLNHR